MITVFKCDYCTHFTQDKEEMRLHELKCSFNPINKKCYSCKHSYEDGYPISGHSPGCEIGLDAYKGEKEGNCKGYEVE